MAVLLETSLGDLVIDLHFNECPKACLNFLKLCKIKYYNNHLFYKVEKDFIAQTGDPTGTGKGGESIYQKLSSNPETPKYFEDEIHASLRHDQLGTVAMANKGPNLNSSQFYITLTDRHLDYLDDKHTVFGIVTEGREVLEKINNAFVDDDHRPFRNIRIRHTVILDDPFEDPDNLEKLIPDASPIPTRDIHDVERLADDDDLDDRFKGLTEQEIEEQLQAKEAESRAVVLEMIGDIPDADIKPPENILFVAQLNPITTDEDLELLFSRFGTIQSCEIIRDWKTGDSLQYAFIEFASEEQCEQAYLKMNNVVVDDRRIKVDFSQSVAKLWNNHRRGIKQTADPDPSGRKPWEMETEEPAQEHSRSRGSHRALRERENNRKRRRHSRSSDRRRRDSGSNGDRYRSGRRRERSRSRSPHRRRSGRDRSHRSSSRDRRSRRANRR